MSRGETSRLAPRRETGRLGRASHAVRRWLAADARDVVELRPARRDVPRVPDAADPRAEAALQPGLRRWRVRIQRRRAVAVVRRALLVAVAVAIVLAAVAHGGALPLWLVIAAPAAIAVLVAALLLRRRPSLESVAYMLDERLALAELLGTAYELETVPRRDPNWLEQRVVLDASRAVGTSLLGWRALARRAPREWLALLLAAAALAALGLTSTAGDRTVVVVVPPHAGTANRGPANGARTNARRGPAPADDPQATADAGRRAFNPYVNRHLNAYQRALARQEAAHPQLSYTAPGVRGADVQSAAQGAAAGETPNESRASTPGGATSQAPTSSAPAPAGGAAVSPVGSSTPAPGGGGNSSSSGAQRQQAGARPLTGSPGTSSPAGRAPPGSQVPNATGGARGGAPTGGTQAGHARGTTQAAATPPAQLATGSQGLPLQGNYEATREGGSARAGDTGGGGGGRARDRTVSGGSASGGGSFPYIPPDVASVSGAQQGLQANYLTVLTSLTARSW